MNLSSMIRAEWVRFCARPVHRYLMLALGLLLLVSATWSGLEARTYRAEATDRLTQWEQARDKAVAGAAQRPASNRAEAGKAVSAAHALGRGELPATWLPATGGLVLGIQQYQVLPTAIRATVESRYTDGRVMGPLSNPLLSETGLPGFPAIIVLLVPLAALALTAGLVQEEREQGTWRLICAQSSAGLWAVFVGALAVRWAAVFVLAGVASLCAFAIDPASDFARMAVWLAALAVFTAFWVLAGALLSLLPVSAAAALTAGLGLWLALTFAVPAMLAWNAERVTPMPSRLTAIVELRAVQEDAEEREAELLAAWYANHPGARPSQDVSPSRPTWPVTFMPRFEEQERRLRPRMRSFDQARAVQSASIERGAWLSPPLALLLVADRLAGIDAARYARYADAVDHFEDRWRGFVIPRMMSYQGVTRDEFAQLPVFGEKEALMVDATPSHGSALWGLLAVCVLLMALVGAFRAMLSRP